MKETKNQNRKINVRQIDNLNQIISGIILHENGLNVSNEKAEIISLDKSIHSIKCSLKRTFVKYKDIDI